MATFPPIDMAIAKPEPRFIRDPETQRAPRRDLLSIAFHDGSHNYPYCWGFTIFRTVYTPGSDEAFAKAIDRLAIYAKQYADDDILHKRLPNEEPRDPLPNRELWSRYYNEAVEDPETLANAGVEEVGRRFDAWVSEHFDSGGGKRGVPNSRFRLCLMLDQQSIDSILAMPENPRTGLRDDPHIFDRWVKVVTDEQWADRGRLWLRVGVSFVWLLWFGAQDPDFMYEEAGWADESDGVLNFWGMRDWHS
ncbi:hypothetical protein ColTof4_04060 [Colletotrichum tofieldiae]|nr:hypothetical protein ColTof3_13907 [Colletotrichum tofieldiae]GKT71637.1 hypothetical protein ColTof4_04060 [Colletotrichum tofieldiae]